MIGFGTASLWRCGSLRAAVDVVRAASDAGFEHFDTAPLYGFGFSERVLGEALGGVEGVSIATKVGLYPPGGADQLLGSIRLRKAAGKVLQPISRAVVDSSVERATSSLEGSLRRLKRDHVDVLLLHEPDASLFQTDEWQSWKLKQSGRVGRFGVCGEPTVLAPWLGHTMAGVVQTRWEAMEYAKAAELQIAFGMLSSLPEGEDPYDTIARRSAQLRNRFPGIMALVATSKAERVAPLARALWT